MNAFLESLRGRAALTRRRIVFPESGDARTLAAVVRMQADRLVDPVLIGASAAVREAVGRAGGHGGAVEIVEPASGGDVEPLVRRLLERRAQRGLTRAQAERELASPLVHAALLVAEGHADGAVAGATHTTGEVLRAAITCIGTAPGIRVVSSSFYMVVRPPGGGPDAEVLTFTDAGVVPSPTAEELSDIAAAAASERRRIVGDEPRVAFLSYSTRGSADGDDVRKMRAALELFRTREPDILCDGELQADAALIPDVALRKAPGSPLAGTANVLVFPDLGAANIAYKLVQRLAGAGALGPILQGLSRPFNDLSRGATAEDIAHVACITALQAS